MELRDALRMLRSEVGLTQTEFAAAVFVSFSTVNRWENKGMRPNVMQSKSILDLAKRHHVSALCLESLTNCLLASRADDGADKARLSKASEQLKLEQHDLLTAEQFRATMDNIDMALIGQRFYNHDPQSCDIFYRNSFIVKTLGYTPAELEKNIAIDPFFAIAPEHREELLQKLGALLTHKISTGDFLMQFKAIRNDGTTFWLEMKIASLTEYSYGQEVFTTFCDITNRVEAEQKYKEEVLLRNVSMQVMFSNIHCDLTENRISRHYNLSGIIGTEYSGQTLDELFGIIADLAPDGADKISFSEIFTRDALLRAYDRGDCYGNSVLYNKNVHRWFRIEYLIVKNPVSGNLHALIYIFDIQKQVLSDNILSIFFDKFFDYVGLIDVEAETIEPYYYSDEVFKEHDPSKRLYAVSCADRFRLYGYEETSPAESSAVSLQTVKAMLENSEFYSTVLHLQDYDGSPLLKKVTYTYLDKSRDIIIMAQSDLDKLTDFLKYHKGKYTGNVYQSIDNPVMERRCE